MSTYGQARGVSKPRKKRGRTSLGVLAVRAGRECAMNLTIRQQVFFSYITMVLFVLLIGIYTITSLAELNKITSEMVSNEIIMGEKLSRLVTATRFSTSAAPQAAFLAAADSGAQRSLGIITR